ncbi:MAG: hypothetical protein Q7S02_00170 [bacterium]|nr:hypothetical protein [bacterium]
MTKTSPMYPLFGILCALAFAFVLSAFTGGCTKSVEASTPPAGWQCDSVNGTCSRVAKIAFELPEITVVGCVPVDEPGRVTFCEYEVDPIVGPNAVATNDHTAVLDGVYPPALAE